MASNQIGLLFDQGVVHIIHSLKIVLCSNYSASFQQFIIYNTGLVALEIDLFCRRDLALVQNCKPHRRAATMFSAVNVYDNMK